jgi:GNAT superfamily N-acetyltransferase
VNGLNRIVIRDAGPADFEAILQLYGQLNSDDDASPTPLLQDVFTNILHREDLRLSVLQFDSDVVGSTYLNVIPNLTRGGRPYAVIENVIVHHNHRGRGLGKRLMASTLDAAWAAGCYKALLQTGSSRESTHAFYRACGFSPHDKTAYVARPASGTPAGRSYSP